MSDGPPARRFSFVRGNSVTTDNQNFYRSVAGLIQREETASAISQLSAFLDQNPTDPTALSMMASAHLRSGDTEKAVQCFEKGIEINPNSDAAHAELAFALMKSGATARAIEHFNQAVELNPEFHQPWCFLEQLQYQAANYPEAMRAVTAAEACDPLDAEYRAIQEAMRANQPGKAEQIARDMLKRQPGHPRAVYMLAHLAGTVGAHEESLKILKYGLEHHPANIMLRRAIIQALEKLGAYVPAVFEAEELTKISPDYLSWLLLSKVHGHTGDHDKSLAAAEKAAMSLEQGSHELGKIDLLRGHALKIMGRRAESEQAYRDCIKNTPSNGAGWWGLADFKNYAFSDQDKRAMETLATDETADAPQRCQAAFALAKAFENDKDDTTAFKWYKRANDMRPNVEFDPDKNDAFCDGIVTDFDTAIVAQQAKLAPKGPTPIFIVGMPRAGSTLIEQILASHSQVEGTMELSTLPNIERRISIMGGRKFKTSYPASLARFSEEDLTAFGQAYLDETAIYRTDKAYFIDKLPPNFERIGLIHKILPQAIIIDARRHPLDCGFSCYKQHFAGGHEYSYNLAHIGNYYNGYLKIMDHWHNVLPGKVMCVQYENMVQNTEATVRAVLDHVGLDFEPGCLRFFENKRAVRTASSEQVRQPIFKTGIGNWHTISEQLSPLIDSLGPDTMARFQ